LEIFLKGIKWYFPKLIGCRKSFVGGVGRNTYFIIGENKL